MKISIIGAGHIGSTLGIGLAAAGHRIKFAARDQPRLLLVAKEVGAATSTGSLHEAAEFADVVIVATPYNAWPSIGSEVGLLLRDKVVVDASNPYAERDGDIAAKFFASGEGSRAFSAKHVPGAKVVKAFNTLFWKDLAERGRRGIAIAIAGDDTPAVKLVAGLVRDMGFMPVVAGHLKDARHFDAGQPAYGKTMLPNDLKLALTSAEA